MFESLQGLKFVTATSQISLKVVAVSGFGNLSVVYARTIHANEISPAKNLLTFVAEFDADVSKVVGLVTFTVQLIT